MVMADEGNQTFAKKVGQGTSRRVKVVDWPKDNEGQPMPGDFRLDLVTSGAGGVTYNGPLIPPRTLCQFDLLEFSAGQYGLTFKAVLVQQGQGMTLEAPAKAK